MPFSNTDDFEKSFPGAKGLNAEQKKKALSMFNSMKKNDPKMADSAAADTAIKQAKMGEMHVLNPIEIRLGEILDEQLETTEFEILRCGEFYDKRYGKFTITESMLQELCKNFTENVLQIDVAVDLNHQPENGAFAWIKSLTCKDGRLYATLKDFTSEGKKILKEKVFKYFSVEFASFETVLDGKKATIPNVLRGLALTNRPVIKGMAPTFYSESEHLASNISEMETFKMLAEILLSEKSITQREFTHLKALHAKLSDEDQAATADDVAKAEEKVEAPADAEAEAEAKKKADEEAAAKAKADEEGTLAEKAVRQLAETKRENQDLAKQLADQTKRLTKMELAEKERALDETLKAVTLSEKTPIGFAVGNKDNMSKVRKFLSELSEAQVAEFKEILKNVTVLSEGAFEEAGHGDSAAATDTDAKIEEAKALAVKISAEEKIQLADAMTKAYKKVGLIQ